MIERPIRVVIADDHVMYRRALRLVLALDGDIVVVGEAGDGYTAVDVVASARPDVVVMDLQMPRLGGVDAIRALTDQVPDARIILATMSDAREDILPAFEAGAHGCVTKDLPGDRLAEAIRAVRRGEVYFSPAVAACLLHPAVNQSAAGADRLELDEREELVLQRLARGERTAQIASGMGIAESTIRHLLVTINDRIRAAARGAGQAGHGGPSPASS
ncbi:response regulator [Nostocoides sp. F2B08]|uniref:response regulator transcription factor n=1 Tax=Nostocoides sp. F2B08 TaxID=2653936 RepID=UPI001262DF77|nr:response regulator transcription factor [Tetrasphaera sp. F2B08]KAB7741859.1 response regulator [Tetrasphaera sp. F2B08]